MAAKSNSVSLLHVSHPFSNYKKSIIQLISTKRYIFKKALDIYENGMKFWRHAFLCVIWRVVELHQADADLPADDGNIIYSLGSRS